ncbi:ABC transporter ATP-binding protein [Notoacmeibacter sp. MSK16QG-6]|uniref:ABC transporter ATP-binding protein n=1 Tax=Notoacmeibacter sp. MSK16QG-6 TaxID=2957982 RepID=UPI00273A6A18|nr:ATP-binding cassette domain-containing protein [Notoacmeibacter sp. MSK16QG-6]
MADIHLEHVQKSFGAVTVIPALDLEIPDGSFTVLLGPSGCGKSTILRMIAGLEAVTDGEIRIDDRVVNDVSPAERGCAMVFQSYALYPHKTVRGNLSYPLNMAKLPKSEIADRVTEVAGFLELTDLLDRYPRQLSGGQRQRVAMGRAMIRKPEVLLYDEPLSNLDLELRVRLRLEIAEMQRKLKTTAVYVTHDQTEAMTLADTVVVLRSGRIEQAGRPHDLYHRPANIFVAGFIGTPKMNFFKVEKAESKGGKTTLTIGGSKIVLSKKLERDPAQIGVRPEYCALGKGADSATPHVKLNDARLVIQENLGDRSFGFMSSRQGEVTYLIAEGAEPPAEGDQALSFPADRVLCFDGDGNLIA